MGGHAEGSGAFIDCVEYSMYHTRVGSGKVSVLITGGQRASVSQAFCRHEGGDRSHIVFPPRIREVKYLRVPKLGAEFDNGMLC